MSEALYFELRIAPSDADSRRDVSLTARLSQMILLLLHHVEVWIGPRR